MSATRLLCVVAALLASCGEGSRRRACSPELGDASGCGAGEHCIVDQDGIPECADDPGEAGLPLGAVCDGPNACGGAGNGCLSLYGVARCLPFCGADPDRFDLEAQCEVDSPLGGDRLRGRCLSVLPDRPDIGACVFHCNPAVTEPVESDDPTVLLANCPAGSTCALPFDLDFPVCSGDVGPPGEASRACGPQAPCPPGLLCVTAGDGRRCRAAADVDSRCADADERAQALPGVRADAVPGGAGAGEVEYCAPCVALGRAADGAHLAACFAAESGSAAAARCAAEGGRLADLADLDSNGDGAPDDVERLEALLDVLPEELQRKPLWVSTATGCSLVVRLPLEGTTAFVDRPECTGTAHALCSL